MGKSNWKPLGKTIGSLCLDLGKLSFGGLLLGSVLKGGIDPLNTFLLGGVLAIVFFAVGIVVIAKDRG